MAVSAFRRLAFSFVSTAVLLAAGAAAAQTGGTPTPTTPTTPTVTPTSPPPPPPPAAAETTTNELVVTGSRIRTTTFTSAAPLTTITSEQAELQGSVDTSQILQLSVVAANSVQINNFFTGFVTTGGPGINTLSLRGLGPQRTLFLINGERMGPAGVGGTVGPVDLNTIPESMIDHIDILKDGASSIYGSDAVAGVVNVITKTNQDGGDIHAYGDATQHGGGNVYQANGSWGKTFDKGYVNVGFDYYRQDPLTIAQRPFLNCSRDLAVDAATGASADLNDPTTGKDKCFNILTNTIVDLGVNTGFQEYIPNPAAVAGGGLQGFDVPGWQAVGLVFPGNAAATRASAALEPENAPLFGQNTAISPVSRYTVTGFAGYDLTPHAHLYASMLLNQRDSAQISINQFFVEVLNPGNPFNTAIGYNPATNCTGFCFPVPVLLQAEPSTQTVNYARFVLGLKGDIPPVGSFNNWTYDIYGQYSRSDGAYTQEYVKQDRVNATAGAGAGTNGCNVNAIVPFFGSGETMAQAEPGVPCVPVNYIAAAMNGAFTPAEHNFLYTNETGHTTYDHMYLEGSMTGDLFKLPAGPLGAALGFQVRREAIDDTPGQDFIDSNVYNFTTSGITKGSEDIEEIYGELEIPVLKSVPLVDSLNVDISGRFSNYTSYGVSLTYKANVDWKVNDWLTFRGTYGTGFRAPALYELFLADQTSFLSQLSIDPCINWAVNPGVPLNVQKNCAALGIPGTYNGQGAGATILTGGGAGHLKAENSIADTVGVVLTPKVWDQDISIAVDYYTFDIVNQIQQFGAANIVFQCMNSTNFPNNPFCSLFSRNSAASNSPFTITTVNDDYVNVAQELDQGLDVDLRWRSQLPMDNKLTIESSLAWSFYTNTILLGGSVNNYLGQVGQPTFVGNVDVRLDHGPWSFNYFINMIGASSDDPFVSPVLTNYLQTGETVFLNHRAPFYTTSDIAVRRKFDKFTVEAGIKNMFDANPPSYSTDGFQSRIGVTPLASQYDWLGRQFYFDIDAKF